jgi:hypothetical protein
MEKAEGSGRHNIAEYKAKINGLDRDSRGGSCGLRASVLVSACPVRRNTFPVFKGEKRLNTFHVPQPPVFK